jgi:HlyD family secretion protein
MLEGFARIATTLKLDARQQAAFDEAMATMKDRSERMRAMAGRSGGASAAAGGGAGTGGGQGGGDRAARMGERIKQNFTAFRALLSPAQAQEWDAAVAALTSGKRAPVYRLVDGKPEQVTVRVGASDGTRTELLGGDLKEGDLVIVGSARPETK